ncbi:amidohydrolase family protein [Sphingopyxis granuli]|uniref:amidohydrolase family protein n=1 Tax=Sphingopyxis granuli TaxID=267128 RepID=UPI001F53B571|nr:amidohydrolase family protein [Sphingopyxis granuli]UNK79161.1 amidohydrolase family protein [Sphingopyxis granuli]
MKRLAAALASSLLALAAPALAAPQQGDVVIRHVNLVDVEAAKTQADQAVVLRGADIVAVGADAAIARDWRAAKVVEGKGLYLIPGLWDMHVHFGGGPELIEENKALLPLYVANGITTIRDCSGDLPDQVLGWRSEIASGSLFGPRLLTSGAKIEGIAPVWKGTIEVGSEADVDAALTRLQQRDKVDFVKITDSTLKPDLFLYALRQAKARGIRTSGHIPMALTTRQAVDAGISSIEHLDYAYHAGARDEAAVAADFAAGRIDRAEASRRLDAAFDPVTAMAAYRHFAEKGVFVTPTLNGSRILAFLDRDDHSKDEGLAYIGPKLRKTYDWRIERAAKASPEAVATRHAHIDAMARILPMLQQAGVTIIAGTDAGFLNSFNYPAFALHDEIALFVEKGLTPAQALASATRAGPAWFGQLDRYGAIRPGMAADLVLLQRNPLEDIAATKAIDAVVMRGKTYDRAALDAMLADTRAQVAAWNAEDGASE